MLKLLQKFIVVVFFLVFSTCLLAVAGEPDDIDSEIKENSSQTNKNETPLDQPVETIDTFSLDSSVNQMGQERSNIPDDVRDNLEQYDRLIKQKQFSKANQILNAIPRSFMTEEQLHQQRMLDIFDSIIQDQKENERQFGKDESQDKSVQRTIKRLQRQAKVYLLEGKQDLPKDLLIQSLFLDRKNFESKQLLTRCLDLPLGSYQVTNVEKKYWNDSLIQLRSGFPINAVESLTMLANFDPENPMIFERMGSAFYLAGKVKEAVEAWKRALYLDPKRDDLKVFIDKATIEIERQEALSKEYFDNKKKSDDADILEESENMVMQVLRVVNDSNTAFSYAQEVRQKLGGRARVIVEELENGKWAVKIPIKKK